MTRCPLQGFGIRHVLNPDAYRGKFGNDGKAYAEDVEDVIRFGTSGAVAGFLSESIQGVGGAVPLAKGYLQEAYKVQLVDTRQSLCQHLLSLYMQLIAKLLHDGGQQIAKPDNDKS